MSEHEAHGPEHAKGPEHSKSELDASEQLEHARRHVEMLAKSSETDAADRRADAAREIIEKHGLEQSGPTPATETETPVRPAFSHLLNPKLNYTQTLASIQRRLAPASRTFSKVIHTPAVEKASEALETTVARPSVTAGATWTALIIGSIFYFTARRYGYALSGSEIELSFLVGAALGLVIEWLWRTFIRHPR
jgi:hypothetical protein